MATKILPVDVFAVTRGQILYSALYHNVDGTPMRARVTGKLRTWKRRPGYYELPVKQGLRNCFYIAPENAPYWYATEEGAIAARDAPPGLHG